ncbi:hypothetical protein ACOTBX_13495 [Achromobacter xylosoxidans]
MVEVLNAIQTALEASKKLRDLSKKIEDAEIKMLFATLQEGLADAKLLAVELKDQLASARAENADLKEKLEARDSARPTLDGIGYRFAGDDGLYCTACFDDKNKRIRLTKMGGAFADIASHRCPACRASYGGRL